jgi:hypothetical protein
MSIYAILLVSIGLLTRILVFAGSSELVSQNIPSREYDALYDLYNSTNGPYWQYGNLPGSKLFIQLSLPQLWPTSYLPLLWR